jgi:iron complex transport system ATP-binding protein
MNGTEKMGIITEGVSLSYDGHLVLGNVGLCLKMGAVITLLGPNGCGKTTLLRIINGLLRTSQGRILVDGKDISRMRQADLARLMGYVPQSQRSSFPFTVQDIVLTGRMPHISALAQPGAQDVEKASQALKMVGASHLADRPYTQISGGERQLVMIARALAQEPSYLLLDEPTSYLDFKNQFAVLKMICRIAEEKKVTVVMTLHDPNHALMFSDEVVLLRKLKHECASKSGSQKSCKNVVAAGAPDEVMTPENIREAYGIEVESFTIRGRRILFPL